MLGINPGWQARDRCVELLDQVAVGRLHRVFVGPVHRAGQAVAAHDHLGVRHKVLVDRRAGRHRRSGGHILARELPVGLFDLHVLAALDRCGDFHAGGLRPGLTRRGLASRPLLEEQHVCHDFGAGILGKSAVGQADRAQQIGPFRKVLARLVVELVHRALGHHHTHDAARTQRVDLLGQEVVVQQEALLFVRRVVADDDVGKRRVAQHRIEVPAGNFRAGEVLVAHRLLWQQQLGNARGQDVLLDAQVAHLSGQRLRRQHGEQAVAQASLEHLSTLEAEALQRAPHAAYDAGLREVGELGRCCGLAQFVQAQFLLGALGQRPEFGLGVRWVDDRVLLACIVRSHREDVLRQLGGAPAGVARQQGLFLGGGRSAFGFDLLGQRDDVQIALGRGLPRALALEVQLRQSIVSSSGVKSSAWCIASSHSRRRRISIACSFLSWSCICRSGVGSSSSSSSP